jgi:hypothetical protein
MADIELRLRSAMHGAVDGEEAAPEELITLVKRRHRRHLARLGGAAAAALLAIAIPVVIVVNGKISGSGSSPSNQAAAAAKKLQSKLSGLPMPAGKSFQLLVTTPYGAGWYSTATRITKPIEGLPAEQGGYQFNRVSGGWAAWPVSYNSPSYISPCNVTQCAGLPTTFYFIAEGSLTATRIGVGYHGDGVNPGTQARTVWLVTYPRPTTSLLASSFAQLVSSAGRPLGPRYRLPANYLMGRGVGNYLLLVVNTNQMRTALWDPRTSRVLGHFDNVVAQGPEQIVWSRGCKRCQLQTTNVSTGKTLTTPIPGGQVDSLNATLSDDGRLLAVQLPGGELAVYNTVTQSLTRIAGTAISKADFEYFTWQNGGHRLVIAAGPRLASGPDQLAYWQPGEAHLYVATIRDPSEMEQIETGTF